MWGCSSQPPPGAWGSSSQLLLCCRSSVTVPDLGQGVAPLSHASTGSVAATALLHGPSQLPQLNYGRRFVTLYRRHGSRPSPRKRNAERQNGCLRRLTNSCEKKRTKSKGEKERYSHLNAEFQRIARREKKAFLSNQCKEIEEDNRMGKTRDLFKKIRDTKEHFMQRWT